MDRKHVLVVTEMTQEPKLENKEDRIQSVNPSLVVAEGVAAVCTRRRKTCRCSHLTKGPLGLCDVRKHVGHFLDGNHFAIRLIHGRAANKARKN